MWEKQCLKPLTGERLSYVVGRGLSEVTRVLVSLTPGFEWLRRLVPEGKASIPELLGQVL